MKHTIKFALGYALLGALGLMCVAGFVLAILSYSGKADKHSVAVIQQKLNPGAVQAYKDACTAQIQGAQANGVTLLECKLVAPKELGLKANPEVKGDHANVALVVKSVEGQVYVVFVELNKSAWTMANYKVTPVATAPATLP